MIFTNTSFISMIQYYQAYFRLFTELFSKAFRFVLVPRVTIVIFRLLWMHVDTFSRNKVIQKMSTIFNLLTM